MSSRKKPHQAGGIRAHPHLEAKEKKIDADAPIKSAKPDRNGPCACGAGSKFKKCCGTKESTFWSVLKGWFGFGQ